MQKSLPHRIFVIGALTMFMAIPLYFASDIVQSRSDYSRSSIATVSQEWGGQTLGGPTLMVPVKEKRTRTRSEKVVDHAENIVRDPVTGTRNTQQNKRISSSTVHRFLRCL